jgi:hypothetical protein
MLADGGAEAAADGLAFERVDLRLQGADLVGELACRQLAQALFFGVEPLGH